jgi:hypothetical protein
MFGDQRHGTSMMDVVLLVVAILVACIVLRYALFFLPE